MNIILNMKNKLLKGEKMNEYKLRFTPEPKSIASIGGGSYKTTLAIDQHFNWFQKLMWKWCFGVKIKDCN